MKARAPATQLNLGVIGTGWPGQQHARVMSANPAARLYACADLDEARRGEFEATYSPDKSFSDYHDLMQDPAVDAVIICLPNFLHFPASLAALEAGKHVFCEKPPTLNSLEMKVLHEEAAKRGLIYFFGRQFRFVLVSGRWASRPPVLASRQNDLPPWLQRPRRKLRRSAGETPTLPETPKLTATRFLKLL